ncbi:MAG: hypothetical protein ACOYMB_00090 [Patescibacteria group bacterium]
MTKAEEELEREVQIKQLLKNSRLTSVILSFLDFQILYELTDLVLKERLDSQYEIKKDDLVWGVLPEELKKLHQLIDEKKEALAREHLLIDDDLDGVYRNRNEAFILPLLFEHLVHGALEIPWAQKFVIADNWQVVISGANAK